MLATLSPGGFADDCYTLGLGGSMVCPNRTIPVSMETYHVFYDGNSIFNLTVCCSEFSLPPSPGEAELQWNIGLACNTYNEYMYAFSVDGAIGQRRPLWSSACRDVPPTHRIGDCQLVSSLWGRKGVYANTMATVPSGSIINEVARRYRPSRKEEWKLYICEIEKVNCYLPGLTDRHLTSIPPSDDDCFFVHFTSAILVRLDCQITFTCAVGYVLDGVGNASCSANLSHPWGELPSCKLPPTSNSTHLRGSPIFIYDYSIPVMLRCAVEGYSLLYAWERNGSMLTQGHKYQLSAGGATLTINSLTPADVGTYTCQVSNSVGEVELTGMLIDAVDYYSAPRLPPGEHLSTTQLHEVNEVVMVSCVLLGTPPPTLTWVHLAGELSTNQSDRVHYLPNGTLVFNSTLEQDTGYYNCTGRNQVGVSWRQYILLVKPTTGHTSRSSLQSHVQHSEFDSSDTDYYS